MKKNVSAVYMAFGLLFTTCLIVSNIVAQKLFTIGHIEVSAALLIFPVSYIVNDIIVEVWGYRKARFIIWYGFLMNFLTVVIFQLAIAVPASANFEHQESFGIILGTTTIRIACASFFAFLCGSFLNAYVMSKMKVMQRGRGFSIRAIVSTIAGEGVDSLIFFTLAFYAVIPTKSLIMLIVMQMTMKTFYEVIVLPFTNLLVKWIKKREQTDVYDTDVNYNPLKIGEI